MHGGFAQPAMGSSTRMVCSHSPGPFRNGSGIGCPWSSQASVKHHAKVDEDGRLWLRRGACADGQFRIVPSSAFKSCASCQRLCLRDKFVEKLAVWGFFFDLTDLVHSMYTGNLRLQRDVWRQVQEADYSSIALRSLHMSMQDVERLDWAGCMRLFNQIVGHTPPDRQNQACRDFLAARWSWLPRTEQVLRSPDLYRRLDRHTECLGGLTNESGFTGSLVAELRAERLDAQHTCKTMISAIAKRTGLLGRNRQRTTATNIPGQSEGDLAEVGFMLGALSSTSALLRVRCSHSDATKHSSARALWPRVVHYPENFHQVLLVSLFPFADAFQSTALPCVPSLPQLHREKDSKPSVPLDVLMHNAGMKEVKIPGLVHRLLDRKEWAGQPCAYEAIKKEKDGLVEVGTWIEEEIISKGMFLRGPLELQM